MPQQWPWQPQQQGMLQGTRFVKGWEGAMSAPCLPGRTLLMDEDAAVFYVKEVSGYGNATIRTFEFEEVEQPKPPEYVTKDEFEELKARYESAVSKLESLAGAQPGGRPQGGQADGPVAGQGAGGGNAQLWANQQAAAR